MSRHKQHSFNDFHLPEIKRYSENRTKTSSIYSQNHSILSRFQQQLKVANKKYQTQNKQKRRPYRIKTIDVNQQESYDDLRRQLRSIKQQVNYNMKEYGHKIQNKFEELMLLQALKKQSQPQIMYQPMPIPIYYPPPIYPPTQNMYPQMPTSMQNHFPSRQKLLLKPKIYSKKRLKNFRKHALAVLFTIRLRKFVAKVTQHRKQMFNKYLYNTNEFKQEASRIKKLFIDGLRPFLVTVLQRQDSQIKLSQGDSKNYKKQKLATTHKLIELLAQCLRKSVESNQFEALIKSVYYFCKHGSYACAQKLLTNEELENMSVSEKHFYLQADKSLEKSQIINFLFMKIIIYNILAQPWKIDEEKFDKDKQTLQQNLLILSSILYEILMDIQDDLIVNSPQCYRLNNYQQLKGLQIYPSQSLTIKPGQYRKNEVISGLINQNIVKSTYNLQKTWIKQKNQLIEIIELIRQKIVNYHKKLIRPFL